VNLAVLLCSAAVLAQDMTRRPQVEESAKSGIFLDVVVTPKKGGAPVAGLTQQNFTVTDNQAPEAITWFQAMRGSEAPVAVTVVLDTVNTSYMKAVFERNQIERFLEANHGNLAHPTQLAIFTDKGLEMQGGFTKDGNALGASLHQDVLRVRDFAWPEERIQRSIWALEQLSQREAALPGRKLVLWVSPGWPMLPDYLDVRWNTAKQKQAVFNTITGLSTVLREARVTLYCIEPLGAGDDDFLQLVYYKDFLKVVRKPARAGFANLALQVISTQTGGLVLNSPKDLAEVLDEAVDDSNAFYELAFDPAKGAPDEYHQIEVKVGEPGLIARTRTGYYLGKWE